MERSTVTGNIPRRWPVSPSGPRRPDRGTSGTGFTFIEMVMVITLIAVLATIAIPIYQAQILASKEAVLKHNLAIIRERLDQYKADKGNYPDFLEELVERGYLREIPEDPMTETNEWEPIYEDFDPEEPEEELGIYDVRSLSSEVGTNGVPYSEW